MENLRIENNRLVFDESGETYRKALSEVSIVAGSFGDVTEDTNVRLHSNKQMIIDGTPRGALSGSGSTVVTVGELLAKMGKTFDELKAAYCAIELEKVQAE